MPRLRIEYGGCSVCGPATSWRAAAQWASTRSAAGKVDVPQARILPARTRSVSASTVSSMAVSGSGRWTWYRSIRSVPRRRSERLDGAVDPPPRVALAVRIVAHRAVELGGQHHVVASTLQRIADDLLALPGGVDVGRVDEVDAGIDRPVDDPSALGVVGVAPGAEHHRAQPERADLDAGAAERAVRLHRRSSLVAARRVAPGLAHLSPRTNGRASAAGWRTRLANTAIAPIVTIAGAMARIAGSTDW